MKAKPKGSQNSSSPTDRLEIPAKWRDLFRLIPGYDPIATAAKGEWFDAETAEKCIGFFHEHLKHVEGAKAGQPVILERWQQAIIGCAFGWKRADGTRRYREVFQYVPRKNGKSTMLGGLICLVAYCDDEPGAQLFSAAATRDQAGIVFKQARGMIVQNPELAAGATIHKSYKSMTFSADAGIEGTYRALAADADTQHGHNVHFVVVDELHNQPNSELVEVLETGTAARRQPLVWYITTSDFDRPSVCNQKLDYAEKVRDGVIRNSAFLPVIYAASIDDDWKNPETWRKANPNLGVSLPLEYLARECQKAIDAPTRENAFKRLHLNIKTQTDIKWIPLPLWDACGGRFDPVELVGRDCHAGLDFGFRDDYAALVLDFPIEDEHFILPFFWIPQNGRRDRRSQPTADFVAQKFVTVTPGDSTDIEAIYKTIDEAAKLYNVVSIAIDPNNARKQGQDLMAKGLNVVEFRQAPWTYNEPCRGFEQLLKDRKVYHNGNPVLRWMAANVQVVINGADLIMPKKSKSADKIDGIVAMLMALGRAMLQPADAPPASVYETRGLRIL